MTDAAGRPGLSRSTLTRWVVGVVVMFLPMVAVALSPLRGDAFLVYVGILPTLVALSEGFRAAVLTAVATPAVFFVGLLIQGDALVGTIYLAVLCLGLAVAHRHGMAGAATYVVSQAALAVIARPTMATLTFDEGSAAREAAAASALVLVGSAWVVLVGRLLLHDLPVTHHDPPPAPALRAFAITLTVLVALATFVALHWVRLEHAWWVVLSLLVMVQPDTARTRSRVWHRVLGTVAGGTGAALVAGAIGLTTPARVLGGVVALASAVAYLKAPYWVFTALLTAALVLLTFTPANFLRGDLERIGFTLAGGGLVLLAGLASSLLVRPPEADGEV